ncbi:MAG: thiamine pyrophosphate-binding protein, partial [Proteobacteria bacterium]|nr:thiamine pyrophosphate-binding protein [Pseudomonadota bacterium]
MSNDTQVTVGELIALYLENYGVETAFGVISIHNMPILDAIGRRGKIRFVPSRGEAGAVNMADAYARVRGDIGVAVTSTGTGAGNGAGALVEAETAGTPLLHLTGQIDSPYVDKGWNYIHEAKDQPGMLSAICKSYYRISDPAETVPILTQALTDALTAPRGPVSVEIPADIQSTFTNIPANLTLPTIAPLSGEQAALDRLLAAFEKAKRPMLWLGGGAIHAGEEVRRLADLGIAVVTSVNGRGVISEDHPLSMGAYGATAGAQDLYATLDLMVVAGSSLRGNETRNYGLKLPD